MTLAILSSFLPFWTGVVPASESAWIQAPDPPVRTAMSPQAIRRQRMDRLSVDIDVLRKEAFQSEFGRNPKVPKTAAGIRALAARLRITQEGAAPGGDPHNFCGELEIGRLMAALQNPDVEESVIEEVDATVGAGVPTLPKTYLEGHFLIRYTDADINPEHNTTLEKVKQLAGILNGIWNDYTANFKEPKSYLTTSGKRLIDIKIFAIPGKPVGGRTASSWNHIDIHSRITMDDELRLRTVPAHEMFHRVQYAFGMKSGTASHPSTLDWASEGTASWVQKHREPIIGDYIKAVNAGLRDPDKALFSREYDAAPFWLYLGQRAGDEKRFIYWVWQRYFTNGKDMVKAVRDTIKSQIGAAATLESLVSEWSFTNFVKDMTNASALFDYTDDEYKSGAGFGPLSSVPRTTKSLVKGAAASLQYGAVSFFGTDYFVYNLTGKPRRVEIKVTGLGAFGYAILLYKGNQFVDYERTFAGGFQNKTFDKTIDPSKVDRVCLMVTGNPAGGSYTIDARAK